MPEKFAMLLLLLISVGGAVAQGPLVAPQHLGSSGIFSHESSDKTLLLDRPPSLVLHPLPNGDHLPPPGPFRPTANPHLLSRTQTTFFPPIINTQPAITLEHRIGLHDVHHIGNVPVYTPTPPPPYGPTPHPSYTPKPAYKPTPKPSYIHNSPPIHTPPPYHPPLPDNYIEHGPLPSHHKPSYHPPPHHPPTYEPPPHHPPPHHPPPHTPLPHHPPPHHPPPHHPSPYHDAYSIPECAYNSHYNINNTFCLEDEYYPIDTIKYELTRNLPLLDRVLSDVPYQSADNLVDGLTKVEEEGYTYAHYFGNDARQDARNYHYSPEYYKRGGYICPSDIYYGRPKRAVNTYGEWKVIVNLPEKYLAQGYGYELSKYSQTQRLEQCLYPNLPCSYIHPAVQSNCLQKHSFVRLLAYTRKEGLHVDSFKLPVSCSCHVRDELFYQG